jgi:uncharacterized membrane protein
VNALSLVHIGAGTLAMLLGFAMLAMRKGTFNHKVLGWIYVCLMTIALIAIIARTRSHPAPFAGYAVFTLFALAAAVMSSRRRKSLSAWRGWHAGLMLVTLLGATMAAASIGTGALFGATSGALFYRVFNLIIVTFTAMALLLVWRSRTVWGVRLSDKELVTRRRYAMVVATSSVALVAAQWPLAFP